MKDGFYALLKKENYSKGIVVEDGEIGTIINVYIIVGYVFLSVYKYYCTRIIHNSQN